MMPSNRYLVCELELHEAVVMYDTCVRDLGSRLPHPDDRATMDVVVKRLDNAIQAYANACREMTAQHAARAVHTNFS